MKTNITVDLFVLALALITWNFALKKKDGFIEQLFKDVPFLAEQKGKLYKELVTESLKIGGAYLAIYLVKSKL